jgi:hypothetical protein
MQIRQIHARDPACQPARAPREGTSCSKPWAFCASGVLSLAQHDTEQGSAGATGEDDEGDGNRTQRGLPWRVGKIGTGVIAATARAIPLIADPPAVNPGTSWLNGFGPGRCSCCRL